MLKKQCFFVLMVLIVSILSVCFSNTLAAVQESFVLDLDSPLFRYNESLFNDSSSSKVNVYNASENITYWIKIPKNSTIINASFNVTGKIVPIYNISVTSNVYGLLGISLGNVTSHPGNEIVTGTNNLERVVRVLYGKNGSLIWSHTLPLANNKVFSTFVGNVTVNEGNEIAVGSEDNHVYVLNCSDTEAKQAWSYSTNGDVMSVVIGNLDGGDNEVVAGSADGKVYALQNDGTLLWNYSISGINSVTIGNVSIQDGNETIVGSSTGIYVINSTGDLVWSKDLGTEINTVSVGNVTTDEGNEIVAGASDNKVYLLNSSGGQIWNYTTGGHVKSSIIEDVTSDPGNEVVIGSEDGRIYTLGSGGNLIWDYPTESLVRTVAAGNLTVDQGNEVVAGAINGYLYVFNFDYFPTNLSIDVGASGGYDWNYSGKLRETQTAWGFNSAIQDFLNTCTEDPNGFCNVSFVFHSDYMGKLNVSGINITYNYNTSAIIKHQNVSAWSRMNNARVNESVGNFVRNISFVSNPSNGILVRYIKVNSTATKCDYNGTSYNTTAVDGKKVCEITAFTIPKTGSLPSYAFLWDNNMSAGVPVFMSEFSPYNTTGLDNYYWRKNFSIYNNTDSTQFNFTNITANVSLNDSVVKGFEYLNVTWGVLECDITPSLESGDCNTSSPTYYPKTCGDDVFWVCKLDTNSDGVYDYFGLKQPWFRANVDYQVGGSRNLNANLSNPSVTPSSEIWGKYFNYSVYVNDPEGDIVNVTLWVNVSGSWTKEGEVNMTSSGTAWFNLSSNKTWTGLSHYYKFEYQDFNSSGDPIHPKENTSAFSGPDVQKHNVSFVHIQGNESVVNRGENVTLIVRVNDTNESVWVGENVSCMFWVTTNGSAFDSGHPNATNSTGHCVYIFTPDGDYSAGNQTWKAGVYNDAHYLDMNSSDFILTVKGRLNVSMLIPKDNQSLLRNSSNYFLARLKDEYGDWVNASGYNCSFWFNSTYLNSSDTNGMGYCNYSWNPACGVSLGGFWVNVTLSGDASYFYTILGNESHSRINMTDELNTNVTDPLDYSSYKKGKTVTLNSTTNDTCMLASPGDFVITWHKKWKRTLRIYFNESGGINRTREPFIINGTQLEDMGIDLNDWRINYTGVLLNEVEIPSEVKAWTNGSKTEINETQVYMNNYSELVFLLDLDAYQSRTCWIYYNESNPNDYNISYILNGGFENNDTAYWEYTESANCFVAGIDRCRGYTTEEGTETTGNYSLYLYSECSTVGCNTVEVEQNLTTSVDSNYIKVRYRAWGEFSLSGAYLRLEAGNGACNLSVTPGTSYPTSQWNDSLCYNTSFGSAKNVSIKLHDELDSGGGMGASHVYIDYICIANASGDCKTLDSGATLPRNISSQTWIGSGDNITWDIPLNEALGKRRILANASGDYYKPGQDWVDILIYGWSEILAGNISSDYCMYNETFICMLNATLGIFCNVTDANTSLGIANYNVSFYGDGVNLGYNLTNQSGIALWVWENSSDAIGEHNVSCIILDQPGLYYNATADNNLTIYFNITSGNTTGELLQTPQKENASNMTKIYNHSFSLSLFVNNTGNGTMYGVGVNMTTPSGIYASDVECGVIQSGSFCNVTSQINVSYEADLGNQTINVTVSWSNADSSEGNVSNQTSVLVLNNTVLNVIETWINYTIARGDSKTIGNFTVETFGNTEILNITFSEEGQNSSKISQWVSYSPENISNISRGLNETALVNMSVPSNASLGVYLANIIVNATDSVCSPPEECWDFLLLNLTVTVPDWERDPANLSKTIGLISDNGTIGSITLTNNKDANYSFDVGLAGNGTSYITAYPTSFNLTPFGSDIITVHHNTSDAYPPGYWFVNVSISNLDGAFPSELNTSVFLNVINMTVQIISPNQTNPTSPINASDTANITANATLSGVPISDNMVWTVEIGGESCSNIQSRYNSSAGYWEINCSAPFLTGNPLNNTLTVTGNYTAMEGTVVSDSESEAVIYQDIMPPRFSAVEVSPVNYYQNASWVLFSVNVTDNGNVDSVWSNVSYLDTNVTLTNYTQDGNNYTFNFSNPNNVTDYDITVFANDTQGLLNSTTGWFDVYKPLQFIGSSLDPKSRNQTLNFTFYRKGTNYIIHHFGTNLSQGNYNHTIHKRDYDLLVSFGGQGFRFNNVNAILSAEYQHGISNPGNLTNPVRFDLFPNRTSEDISNIDLPNTAENILMAVVVETPYLNYSNTILTLDYTSALVGGSYQEGDLRILYCPNWSFSGRSCPGEFSHYNESITPNVTTNTFTFTVSSSTAYALAESCYPNTCGYTPPGGGGPGGPSGLVTPTGPECGNGVCETGENELNCPQDCLKYAFDIKTDIGDEIYLKLFPGENRTYPFTIINKLDKAIIAFLSLQGLKNYIAIEKDVVGIKAEGNETVNLYVSLPEDIEPGVYRTILFVTSEGQTRDVPVTLDVSLSGRNYLSLEVDLITTTVIIGGDLRFKVDLKNLGYKQRFDINLTYLIKEGETEHILKRQSETVRIEDVLTFTRTLSLRDLDIKPGSHFLETWADFDGFSVKDIDGFGVIEFSLLEMFFSIVPWLILVLVLVAFGYFGRLRYIKWKLSRVRYPLPVNFRKIPQKTDRAFWIGRIADTDMNAWYDPRDLMTHVLVAGSTGAGKSVGASVFVEEALEKNIPIVVFDPTAQWTGFVKACTDENVLGYYPRFRMDKRYAKPYKGMIFEIVNPHLDLDFKEYMNPGEVTVFTMNKLKPGEYDIAVKCIIDSMFRMGWGESTELRMIVVFDEVHRLLEKYGGIGGYISLEKACREFRKWGIGVIMCSQVLADFKEAIAGNVLTDIQLNTKSLVDIGKVKEKYGPLYAQKVSRQGIGVGMIQHPKYNEGKPYFINFRPPYHNPHKISAEEMEMYKEFAAKLEDIERRIGIMKREGRDTFDIELELKLAKDKLKQGRFRMAKIYIESLEKYFR